MDFLGYSDMPLVHPRSILEHSSSVMAAMFKPFLLALLLTVSGVSCDFTLTILHHNDFHSRFERTNNMGQDCIQADLAAKACYGGATQLHSVMKKYYDQAKPNALKLNAGDSFQGSVWYSALKWEPVAAVMDLIGYDAMTLGNHEFDDGPGGLLPFLKAAKFPVLVTNIEDTANELQGLIKKDALIKDFGNEKVGIVGVITTGTKTMASPGPNILFRDELSSVQKAVDELIKKGINKIIVLSHTGFAMEKEICRTVRGVDIVVGGYTNTFLYTGDPPSTEVPQDLYPYETKNVDDATTPCLVVQAYAYGKYVGHLRVSFDNAGVLKNWTGNPILVNNSFPEDSTMVTLLKPFRERVENYSKRHVAQTAVYLDGSRSRCRLQECNLANIVTDAAVYSYVKRKLDRNDSDTSSWTDAAVAFWNSGGVRDFRAPPGKNLTFGNLRSFSPFENTIEKLKMLGTALLKALERGVEDYDGTKKWGWFPQVSGLIVVYNLSKPPNERVHEVMVRCAKCKVPKYEPLDPEAEYDVVVNSYLAGGGDKYYVFKDGRISTDFSQVLEVDMLQEYLQDFEPIMTGEEMRIQFIGDPKDYQTTVSTEATTSGSEMPETKRMKWWGITILITLYACDFYGR